MKLKDENITNLVEEAKKGNIDSLEKLLKESEKEITSILYYLTSSEADISDMVQEILLKIIKNLKNLKNPNQYRSWLNKIARRQYFDFLRKHRKKKDKIELGDFIEHDDIKDKKQEPIDSCISCELAKTIRDSVARLSEPYKMTIVMREFEGLSYDEIAKVTKTNVGTVKSRISRARNQLKEYIRPYME